MNFIVERMPAPIKKIIIELDPVEIQHFMLAINYAKVHMPYKSFEQDLLLQNLEINLYAIRHN